MKKSSVESMERDDRETLLLASKWVLLCGAIIATSCCHTSFADTRAKKSSANISTTWINSPSTPGSGGFFDGTVVRPILSVEIAYKDKPLLELSCGFISSGNITSFLFAIFPSYNEFGTGKLSNPHILWSANGDNPIGENATLELSPDGNLVLSDSDGTKVWSTDTPNLAVATMAILETGNLVLYNEKNEIVWRSFNHPSDTLVLGQKMVAGQWLTSLNGTQEGPYSLSFNDGLKFFIGSHPPQMYFHLPVVGSSFAKFMNGTLTFFSENGFKLDSIQVHKTSSIQYMKLELDGHLRVYEWGAVQYMKSELDGHLRVYECGVGWQAVNDILATSLGDCGYPTVCGNYGICFDSECTCPKASDGSDMFFRQVDDFQPKLGCYEVTPLSCETPQHHQFLELSGISYFNYRDENAAALKGTDVESCKRACLSNCSCKAALFEYEGNVSHGNCFLPHQLFSLVKNQIGMGSTNSSTFIKVQIPQDTPYPTLPTGSDNFLPPPPKNKLKVKSRLGALFGASFVVFIACFVFLLRKKRVSEDEEDYLDGLPRIPMRFSYKDLKVVTKKFSHKLGEGGFGPVFEGALADGTKVAVKRLDSATQGKKEFLAEVTTVGSIHHVHLVKLIGFCAEKSHRLLVYEYMSNGSLDKWIFHHFHSDEEPVLSWQTKHKIIVNIAKGLSYLHEDCSQRIVHLDIKPHNILLDSNFNAKVSDFGLSKLIDRDHSQVTTTLRGTVGYLAPEWLSSKITAKVDVYSFGIVILEIICGRKILDYSLPEEDISLLCLLRRKAEEDRLLEVVDQQSEGYNEEEAVKMIRVALWCLQGDSNRRPSMSEVVKVLEGLIEMKPNLDYRFLTPTDALALAEACFGVSAAPLASILSGPR